MIVVGTGNVARAAGAGTATVQRLLHRRQDLRMLAHAEIVVGAPDSDGALAIGTVTQRLRKLASAAFEFGEDPIAALGPKLRQFAGEESVKIHEQLPAIAAPFGQLRWRASAGCNQIQRNMLCRKEALRHGLAAPIAPLPVSDRQSGWRDPHPF